MSTRATALPAPPPGAGRTLHWMWPNIDASMIDNAGGPSSATNRFGPYSFTSGAGIATGGVTGSATMQYNAALGSNVVRLRNLAGGDLIDVQFGVVHPIIEQQGAFYAEPFCRVSRYVATLAYPLLAGALAAAADLGMEIRPGNVTSLNNGGTRPGVMFGPVDGATFALRARFWFGGGYLVNQQFTFAALGIDVTKFNVYELRVISGDSQGPGQLKAFINGRQYGNTVLWSQAAALLPAPNASGGGFNSLNYRLINTNTGAYDFFLKAPAGLHSIWTPDEANL